MNDTAEQVGTEGTEGTKMEDLFTVVCLGHLSAEDLKGAHVVNLNEDGTVELIPVNNYYEAFKHFCGRTLGIAIKNALIKPKWLK